MTLTGHDTIRARTAQAQLEAIRSRLIGQAERDLAKAELYQNSKRQGERNSAPIVARRGLDAINAVALLDTVIYPPTTPRRAYPPPHHDRPTRRSHEWMVRHRSLNPGVVRVVWPTQPIVMAPREFPETAAAIAKLFAGASVELSRLQAMKRGLL